MMVTRNMEDFITWVDGSSRKRTIAKYNDEVCRPLLSLCESIFAPVFIRKFAFSLANLSWTTSTCYNLTIWLGTCIPSVS
jgi:hypothetical protein